MCPLKKVIGINERGFSLLIILIVVVLITLLSIGLLFYLKSPIQPKIHNLTVTSAKQTPTIAQNETISGKGIPNATVKITIEPSNYTKELKVSEKGEWQFEIPTTLKPGNYTVTSTILDKGKDEVYKKKYQIEVTPKKSLFSLNYPKIPTIAPVYATELNSSIPPPSFPLETYQQYGFPKPKGEFTALTDGEIHRWKKYYLPYAIKASKMLNIDMGLLGMWVYWETYMSTYFDNCFDGTTKTDPLGDYNQNTYCPGWYIVKDGKERPNYQLGWGIYAYEAGEQFRDEFPSIVKKLYPNKTIQQIGQKVIEDSARQDAYSEKPFIAFTPPNDPITNPTTFPDVSLEKILEGAQPKGGSDPNIKQDAKDPQMRQLFGILLKDQSISSYMLARHFKEVEKETNGKIAKDSQYWFDKAQNLQDSVNLIATLYAYSFDPNDVTILNVDEVNDKDGEITPGNTLKVTAACLRESWEIDPQYCQVYYELNHPKKQSNSWINKTYAQDESFPETTSEIHPIPGGTSCGKTCTITIPDDIEEGDYELKAFATENGSDKIVAEDSIPLKIVKKQSMPTPSENPQAQNNQTCDKSERTLVGCDPTRCGNEYWVCPGQVLSPNDPPEQDSFNDNKCGACGIKGGINPACKDSGREIKDQGLEVPVGEIQIPGSEDKCTIQDIQQQSNILKTKLEQNAQDLSQLKNDLKDDKRLKTLIDLAINEQQKACVQ